MRTELIIGESAFTELADEWDQLAARSFTATPFQTLAYQRAWWTNVRPDGAVLLTVATRDDSGKLIGIGCFYCLDGQLHFNGCIEETDYLDLIAPADHAETAWRATWDCLRQVEEPRWETLDLCNIPADSPTRLILPALAQQHNSPFEETILEVCPVVTLPDSMDSYLESLDSKQRRELNRKLRRAEAAGVETTIVDHDDIAADVDTFLELLQKSTFEKRDWLNEGRRALFHEVGRAAHEAGMLQLMFTSLEGQPAAALFNFDYNDRIWVYNSGLDPAAFSALSPGVVLTASAIAEAIKLGRGEFDFMRGDEEYKYRFGAMDTKIYRLHIERVE